MKHAPGGRNAFLGLREEARICARCGACRAVCPVYAHIGWESASPRGKMALAQELLHKSKSGGFGDAAVRRALGCTLCGHCKAVCPAGIDTRQCLLEVREEIRAIGREPEAYDRIAAGVKAKGNVGSFDNAARSEWMDDLEEADALEGPDAEVGYFVGCVASFYPMVTDIPVSFVELVGSMGGKVAILGEDELCCGFPLIVAGMRREAEDLIQRNLERVEGRGFRTLVTGCPSCFHTWRHVYPGIAGRALSVEVVHFTQFLLRCLQEGLLDVSGLEGIEQVVTYHDPCDLGRTGGIYDEPRQVIESIPGVTLVEMAHHREEALCCGGGGNLQSLDEALTKAIADRRIHEASETGASVLVTACQQCVQVLAEAARRNKLRVEVVDIVQLLRRAFA